MDPYRCRGWATADRPKRSRPRVTAFRLNRNKRPKTSEGTSGELSFRLLEKSSEARLGELEGRERREGRVDRLNRKTAEPYRGDR